MHVKNISMNLFGYNYTQFVYLKLIQIYIYIKAKFHFKRRCIIEPNDQFLIDALTLYFQNSK